LNSELKNNALAMADREKQLKRFAERAGIHGEKFHESDIMRSKIGNEDNVRLKLANVNQALNRHKKDLSRVSMELLKEKEDMNDYLDRIKKDEHQKREEKKQ
jgi:hypothetical protein